MNHLWFDMSLKDAVQAPRVHSQLIPDKVFVETRFPNETVSILEMYKHKVHIFPHSFCLCLSCIMEDNVMYCWGDMMMIMIVYFMIYI